MAQEYSYNDLVRMQEQAIRRVRDMQERARLTVQEQGSPVPEEESPPIETPSAQEKKEEKPQPPLQKPKPQNPLGNLLNLDKDKAVILPLLLLLGRESSDNILLMALMYIMA